MLTLQDLRDQKLIVLEAVVGSHAYGLNTPASDVDLRGVYVLPQDQLYGLDYVPQVADAKNDIVFYELGRFVELLLKNNPTMLELLAPPADCLRQRHPIIEAFTPELFLSKQAKDSFAGYAWAQIKKARGLNKKMMQPMEKARKSLLHFCYVTHKQGALPLLEWLEARGLNQLQCGLNKLPHMEGVFGVFTDPEGQQGFRGILPKENANEVSLSSIPKGLVPDAHLYWNKDGYTKYCKDHKEYWEWVAKRNPVRYESNAQHGKNYDAKNMMHTFRLLDMAREILSQGQLIVRRPNREHLLQIRSGNFEYEALIKEAESRVAEIDALAATSPLPAKPNREAVEKMLVQARLQWYAERNA